MTTFNFNDRNSYKAYIIAWKAEYRENSKLIRNLKVQIKDAQRADDPRAGILQSQRQSLRSIQTYALIERAEAKVEAQRQYMAAREAVTA